MEQQGRIPSFQALVERAAGRSASPQTPYSILPFTLCEEITLYLPTHLLQLESDVVVLCNKVRDLRCPSEKTRTYLIACISDIWDSMHPGV